MHDCNKENALLLPRAAKIDSRFGALGSMMALCRTWGIDADQYTMLYSGSLQPSHAMSDAECSLLSWLRTNHNSFCLKGRVKVVL